MPTVAYLGPERTNTHLAALAKFGRRSTYLHAPTVEDVFRLVEREEAEFGVVPIENSLEGAVTHTLDRFIEFKRSPVTIHGEIEQPIKHCLILRPETPRERVRIVYSPPQALAQCSRWLDKNLPNAIRRETSSTAEAVERLSGTDGVWKSDERAAIAREDLVAGIETRLFRGSTLEAFGHAQAVALLAHVRADPRRRSVIALLRKRTFGAQTD